MAETRNRLDTGDVVLYDGGRASLIHTYNNAHDEMELARFLEMSVGVQFLFRADCVSDALTVDITR